MRPTMQSMNLGFGLAVKTLQDLGINLSLVEQAIQGNLQVFRDMDWSTMVKPEDLGELTGLPIAILEAACLMAPSYFPSDSCKLFLLRS